MESKIKDKRLFLETKKCETDFIRRNELEEIEHRTEKSVRMKLFFLDMISEDDVVWMDKIHKKDY